MATNYVEKPRKNENPERFIKRFIKKCKQLGILDEMKERRQFVKPSEKKRLAKKKAIARHKKNLRQQD
jgi:small subunit ribosomal protein S21